MPIPVTDGMDEAGRSIADRLFEQLSEAIVRGELAPGSKLSEPRIASRYAVSRGPLREALRRLEERQLVVRTPRQGARVIVPTLAGAIELSKIREVLEGLAARDAARYGLPEERAELRAMLVAHGKALKERDPQFYWQAAADADFHFLVARMSRNAMLFDLLCNQYYALLRLHRMQHRAIPGRALQALREHERVADAIAEGDAELAEILMRRHIASARSALECGQGNRVLEQ